MFRWYESGPYNWTGNAPPWPCYAVPGRKPSAKVFLAILYHKVTEGPDNLVSASSVCMYVCMYVWISLFLS